MKGNSDIKANFNTLTVLNTNGEDTNSHDDKKFTWIVLNADDKHANNEENKIDTDPNQIDPKHDTETTKHKDLNNLPIESERKAANTYRTLYFLPIPIAYLQGSHKDKYKQSYKWAGRMCNGAGTEPVRLRGTKHGEKMYFSSVGILEQSVGCCQVEVEFMLLMLYLISDFDKA